MENSEAVTLSFVVVNFETPDYTLDCIQSIYRNPPSYGYEIILVDNGSKDGSLEFIRKQASDVICIETGCNLGFSRANNLGINNARGKFILLLNSDTKILDNSLDRMLRYLIANTEVGAVGPRQLDGKGRLQLSWGDFPTLVSEIYRKLIHHRLSINDFRVRDYLEEKYADRTEVDWVSGSCLMARKKALLDAGFLDEHYFMYFEDIDLCRRVKEGGWGIRYLSDMTILHYGGVSAKKNIMRVLVEYRRSQIHFTRKYYGLHGVLVLKALLLLKSFVNFFRWGSVFLVSSVLLRKKRMKGSYASLLLNKKTIELIFGLEPIRVTD